MAGLYYNYQSEIPTYNRRQQKDEIKGFIPKLAAWPEYGTVYKHQGMLLQNLHKIFVHSNTITKA